jgi:hypothetical protein
MKKLLISTSAFLVAIVAIIISLCCVKPTLKFDYEEPETLIAYATSTTGTNSNSGHSKGSIAHKELNKRLQEMFQLSMINYVVHGVSVKPVISQDLDGNHDSLSSDMLRKNYAVRVNFEQTQSQVVVYDGSTKTIEYQSLYFIMDPNGGFQQVVIYFATSSSASVSSFDSSPMFAYADTTKVIEYIDALYSKFDS